MDGQVVTSELIEDYEKSDLTVPDTVSLSFCSFGEYEYKPFSSFHSFHDLLLFKKEDIYKVVQKSSSNKELTFSHLFVTSEIRLFDEL